MCAGWITPQVVEELDIDLADYRRERVLQPITGFISGLGERIARRCDYDRIVSYGIRRCEFDHYLLQRSGAHLRLGEPLQSMRRVGERWIANGEINAGLVVGAGGHFCPVARFLGAQLGKDERAICAQEIEFEMTAAEAADCSISPERPELYFCDDLKGYGWCFRKGDYLNVGLGREGNERLTTQVHAFGRWLVEQGRIPARITERFKGHAYLLYSHAARRSSATQCCSSATPPVSRIRKAARAFVRRSSQDDRRRSHSRRRWRLSARTTCRIRREAGGALRRTLCGCGRKSLIPPAAAHVARPHADAAALVQSPRRARPMVPARQPASAEDDALALSCRRPSFISLSHCARERATLTAHASVQPSPLSRACNFCTSPQGVRCGLRNLQNVSALRCKEQ